MDCEKCIAMKYCNRENVKIINTDQSICDIMQRCSTCHHSRPSGKCQLFLFDSVKECPCWDCFLKPVCSSFCDERRAQFDKTISNLEQFETRNF
jgi:hypothetical protein